MPLAAFLAQADVNLVILDGPSITTQQIQRLRSVLASTPSALACYGSAPSGLEAALGRHLRLLPAAFAAVNLDAICGSVLAR